MTKKQPIREIEKDIKKVEKTIKRNWKKIISVIAVCVIFAVSVLFITGLRIRFAVQDDLVINLRSSQGSFTITNKQKQNITFESAVDNSIFCTADCSYIFYDRSEEKILDQGQLMLKNKGRFNRTYQLEPYRKGSGQKIYSFEIQCLNIRSFLCNTKSPLRKRSAFITLNYGLSEEEKEIKEELKLPLTESFGLINNASANMQISGYLLNETTGLIEKEQLYSNYLELLKNQSLLLNQSEDIFGLWSDEEYTIINSMYADFSEKCGSLLLGTEVFLKKILGSISIQNGLIASYNSMKKYFFDISESNRQYSYYSSSKDNITNDFNAIYSRLQSISLNISGYSSLPGFEEDINSTYSMVKGFNDTLSSNYNSIIGIGKNISLLEYGKKCYIGYCENTTGDVCSDLNKIFSEYKGASYAVPGNISLPDVPYYEISGDKLRILLSNESLVYYEQYCVVKNISEYKKEFPDINKIEEIPVSSILAEKPIKNELTENPPLCCVYGECSPCCATDECKNNPALFPVILIHGHSLLRETSPEPLLDGFNKIQYQLQEDGYLNAGIIRFDFTEGYKSGEWGLSRHPITVKASYYYDYFYSVGSYIYITRSRDNIDTYAVRLNDIIRTVKTRTGRSRVNIVAHSMGGLVARRYLQIFGEDSVNKLILIGSPNKGISGDIKRFCHIFGEKRECEDMYEDSILIKKLNDPNYKLGIKIFTISGMGCKTNRKDGDGTVTFESSFIDYATSYIVNGTCDDVLGRSLHSDLLDIDKYPVVYDYITDILKED